MYKVGKDLSRTPCSNFSVVIKVISLQFDAICSEWGTNSSRHVKSKKNVLIFLVKHAIRVKNNPTKSIVVFWCVYVYICEIQAG